MIGSGRKDNRAVALVPPRGQLEERRTQIASLPEWAGWRAERLGRVMVPGRGEVRYLSAGLPTLSPSERSDLERHIASAEVLLEPADGDNDVKLITLTKMLLALSSAQTSEHAVEAKGEAYLHALEDAPAWAVADAVSLWIRGKAKDVAEKDFAWAPSPAVLARVTRDVMWPYREAVRQGRLLLEAKPMSEI